MSWGTCYSGSNNIHFDYPAIMSDGRNYANWLPGAAINEKIRKDEGIKTNWDYRRYLIQNADTIIKNNQIAACDECCAVPNGTYSSNTNEVGTNEVQNGANTTATNHFQREMYVESQTPYLYKSCSDNSRPRYGYQESDLKNMYASSLNLQSRMRTPVLSQSQLLQQGYPHQN